MFNQQTVTEYSLVEKVKQPQNPVQPPQPLQQPMENQNDFVTRGELQSLIADTIRDEMQKNRGYRNNKKDG